MKDFNKLINAVIKKKRLGYRYHRYFLKSIYFEYYNANDILPTDVEIAKNILKIINIKNQEDLFLAFCCVSLISSNEKRQSYVLKNNTPHENYYAKKYIDVLILFALQNKVELNFYTSIDEKKRHITYVNFSGVQFSFHNAIPKMSMEFDKANSLGKYKMLQWDQSVKFQNGAKEVFVFALHLKNLSRLNYINETPLEYAESFKGWIKGRKQIKGCQKDNGRKI